MFTQVTYQDWLATDEMMRPKLILETIGKYKSSTEFRHALDGNAYFDGENTKVEQKTILQADVVTKTDEHGRTRRTPGHKEIVGNRLANNFFFAFVTQQNQYLLSNGVTMEDAEKARLGYDFDTTMMQIGEDALKHGVGWGYWNNDHIERIDAAKDLYSGFVALLDELTGEPMVGIEFWQLNEKRPLCVRLFEQDGVTIMRKDKSGELIVHDQKRAYVKRLVTDAVGTFVVGEDNYSTLPVVPLYGNVARKSELSDGLKAMIDAYDNIVSDLADNLDRANDVYWVLNNFGGSTDDVLGMLEQINRIRAVVAQTDGMGGAASAEPRTIDVPYQARQAAMDLLKRGLYRAYMALDMDELTGGSLTNVAIKTAMTNLNLKCDRYEWQVRQFVRGVCRLAGLNIGDEFSFKRSTIANDTEIVTSIYQMRGDIDQETALKLNPYILEEDIPAIMQATAAEAQTGFNLQQLDSMVQETEPEGDDDE